MKRETLTIIAVFALISTNAMAVVFENGLSNDITTSTYYQENVEIRDSFLGGITEVNLLSGGRIASADVYENSHINIAGGEVYNGPWTITTGTVNTHDSSVAYISAGSILRYAYANDDSQIIISGGTINSNLVAYESTSIHLSGGAINGSLAAYDNSSVYVSGGAVGSMIDAYGTSVLTFIGKDFVFGGVEVDYGTFDTLGNESVHAPLSGTTLAGDPISYDLYFVQGTQVVLIPEPTTLLLLGLGGLLLRIRK